MTLGVTCDAILNWTRLRMTSTKRDISKSHQEPNKTFSWWTMLFGTAQERQEAASNYLAGQKAEKRDEKERRHAENKASKEHDKIGRGLECLNSAGECLVCDNHDEAVRLASCAIELIPRDYMDGIAVASAYQTRALARIKKAKLVHRVDLFEKAISDSTNAIDELSARAGHASGSNDKLSLNVNLAQAYLVRAKAKNARGNETQDSSDFDQAVRDLTCAINLKPADRLLQAEMFHNRGCILTDDLARHEEAVQDFDRAIKRLKSGHPLFKTSVAGLERAKHAVGAQ
jgi:tetratricopeptide (TPR) repeat protein